MATRGTSTSRRTISSGHVDEAPPDQREREDERPTRKAAQVVADQLRRRIAIRELQSGEQLPNETALMAAFEVSRPTVREALRILEHDGLVEIKRGAFGGARVQAPEASAVSRSASLLLQLRGTTMKDLFAARRVIEPAAVRLLAENPSKRAVKALRAQAARELTVAGDAARFAAEATKFHELVVELAGSNTLTLFSEMLIDIVGQHHRATMLRVRDEQAEITRVGNEHHVHLIDLIEERRAEEAEAFWRFHIDGASQVALTRLGPRTLVELGD